MSAATITWLVLAGLAAGACYWGACQFWPFTSCLRCEGGRKFSPSRKNWRTCRKCKGSGRRLRLGRRVWNFVAGQKGAAS